MGKLYLFSVQLQLQVYSVTLRDADGRFCIVSHLEDEDNKCFVCDSRRPYNANALDRSSHHVQNIVSTFRPDWRERWWQVS